MDRNQDCMQNLDINNGKILIIDDEAGNGSVLERVLRGSGFNNVKNITDSRDAVHVYNSYLPDLIILDLKMPHLDGFAVIDQLKSNPKNHPDSSPPIVVLTAQRDQGTRLRALDAGAGDFLTKPLEMTEAIPRLRNHMKRHLLHNQGVE